MNKAQERSGTVKLAVVLCGGGSRGAYQIGVWRAMRELNISYQIVVGTSIGALNGAMMVQNTYELAKDMWETITLENVMKDGLYFEKNLDAFFQQKENVLPFLRRYIEHKGADISPFIRLLDEKIDAQKVLSSPVDFGVVSLKVPSFKGVEISKRQLNSANLTKYILASASCFPAFPMCKIDGEYYIDGGYYDNLPIDFAFRLAAEKILAVDLNYNITHPQYYNHPDVVYIKPSWRISSFLTFNRETLRTNTLLGYNDAMKRFGKFRGYKYTFFKRGEESALREEIEIFSHFFTSLRSKLSSFYQNRLYSLLSCNSSGKVKMKYKLSPFEQLLRASELCGVLLKSEYLCVYDYTEFCLGILGQFSDLRQYDFSALFKKISAVRDKQKLAAIIKSIDKKYLIGCLLRTLVQNKKITREFKWLSMIIPQEALCAIFLLSFCEKK